MADWTQTQGALEGALAPAGEAAASTLSGLLGRGVSLSPGSISPLAAGELADKFFAGVAQVPVSLGGAASGKGLFLFNESAAALMADLMIGGDGSSPPETLSDLHLSAVGEVGSQMASSFIEALGSALGKSLTASAGELKAAQPGDLAGLAAGLGGDLAAAEFSLDVEGGMPSPFLFVVGTGTAAALGGASGGGGAGAPAAGGSFSNADFGGGSMNAPVVQAAQMSQLSGGLSGAGANNLDLLMDVPLQVTVELGRTEKMVKEVLALGPGSVLELDKLAGEPVDILVNEKPIAKGEVVVIDENFGIRVTEILAPKDRVSF